MKKKYWKQGYGIISVFLVTFAMSLSVLSVFWSGCSSFTANNFGERMAGTKNLRKRNPVMAK